MVVPLDRTHLDVKVRVDIVSVECHQVLITYGLHFQICYHSSHWSITLHDAWVLTQEE